VGSLSDNGGGWPHDGGSPDGLPDLPAEWGVIVIPDDCSELADEVRAVRAELGLSRPQTPWQRFTAHPAVHRMRRIAAAAVRAPVLIVAMAVVVTVASLFASAWPGPARPPATRSTANPAGDGSETLPALELEGSNGQPVALRAQLPAVILLTDGCSCAQLVAETTAAVRAGVSVVTVVSGAPPSAGTVPPTGATPQAQGKTVRVLRDPTDGLRSHLKLGKPDGFAAALLVDGNGTIVRYLPRATSVENLRADLARI
jgi:hypothetical protein